MGDGERTFGVGTSAVSAISQINGDWECEQQLLELQEAEWEAELRRRDPKRIGKGDSETGAFHGNKLIKQAALDELREHRLAQRFTAVRYCIDPGYGALSRLVDQDTGIHSEFETRFGIPAPLASIGDAIFADLVYHRERETATYEWPILFLNSIVPGTDLGRIAAKLMSFIAQDILNWKLSPELHDLCHPAADIIEARARGVEVTEAVRADAESLAWTAVSQHWNDSDGADLPDLAAAAIAKAVGITPESVVYAAWYAARANSKVRSHGDLKDGWALYIEHLFSLFADAPVRELPIIDLNVLQSRLDCSIAGD